VSKRWWLTAGLGAVTFLFWTIAIFTPDHTQSSNFAAEGFMVMVLACMAGVWAYNK
jgi:hypothetical protein